MLETVLWIVILALLAGACAPAPPPSRTEQPKPDPVQQAWYGETVTQLTAMARAAEASDGKGRAEEAAATIAKCRPLMDRLLSAPQPTLAAMEAVSDVDQLYGQMLLRNGHSVWARDFFQKNVTRWSAWKPRTAETGRRLEQARSAMRECDRHMQ
jgi:hypothetical protein